MRLSLEKLKARARWLKVEAIALGLAAGHPQTPWYAKLLVAACVLYAVTPVDLIPDVVPVLGVIDDLIFVPAALALAARCVPGSVLAQCRGKAARFDAVRVRDLVRRLVAWRR
jgi:uncharacterized membrane protein YkvA (DUF1232 family)